MGELPYVEVSAETAEKIVGEPDHRPRMYRKTGNQQEFGVGSMWLCEKFGSLVSPGVQVGAHTFPALRFTKRMSAGKLTAFLFLAPQDNKDLPWSSAS